MTPKGWRRIREHSMLYAQEELPDNQSSLLKVTNLPHQYTTAIVYCVQITLLLDVFSMKMSQRINNGWTVFLLDEWTLYTYPFFTSVTSYRHMSSSAVFSLLLLLHLSHFHWLAGQTQTHLCFSFTGHPILPLQILNLFSIPLRWGGGGEKVLMCFKIFIYFWW